MTVTPKQVLLIEAINEGTEAGGYLDLDQILERLRYKTSKESLQFSIRALIKNGVVEKCELVKRDGHLRRPLKLTEKGRNIASRYCKKAVFEMQDIDLFE